jgi:hypothetical protein
VKPLTLATHATAGTGRPAEVGILVKIYCENFMCHRKLSVTLCPNVNFINGANGSGKSAILAALQICLGARATVTHRGSRLSQLIREGHDGSVPASGHCARGLCSVSWRRRPLPPPPPPCVGAGTPWCA